MLDPLPAAALLALLAEQPENWPGVLFWSMSGAAAFAPLHDAPRLYQVLLECMQSGQGIDTALRSYRPPKTNRPDGTVRRLLHLSDLHFGTMEATENETYLSSCLEQVVGSVDRVVITGDLFNNPIREDAIRFRNFRAAFTRRMGKEPIVIPGNHDQKWLGNVRGPLRELANLEWSNLVIDDELRCVFFCFDSSRDADLARGRITRQQMLDVATLFETKATANPHIKAYLSLALVHHHPFTVETERETKINRLLRSIGKTDEYFLRMDDADAFLSWCAKRNVSVILHGHKHVQRYMSEPIYWSEEGGDKWRELTAIGCGTSLGVDLKPLSYDILTWDQDLIAGRYHFLLTRMMEAVLLVSTSHSALSRLMDSVRQAFCEALKREWPALFFSSRAYERC